MQLHHHAAQSGRGRAGAPLALGGMATSVDAAQYAEALRRELIEGLGIGDLDQDGAGANDDAGSEGDYGDLGAGTGSLRDLDRDLDAFAGHEVIRDILDKGCVPKEYARDIDDRLRAAELDSIQDYIAESDNLVALHSQVCDCDFFCDYSLKGRAVRWFAAALQMHGAHAVACPLPLS